MNAPTPPPSNAVVRHVVEVTAKRGGISRAFGFVIGLLLLGGAFLVGIGLGVGGMVASGAIEPTVMQSTWRSGDSNRIVILPVEGIILDGEAEFVRVAVKNILDDRSVRAVILRVDSPGGAVAASDRIWREVQRLRDANLPVVASYGGFAASGGYYISCHADEILAEPTTITGSIGVIAQLFTFNELMEKVGVEPVTLVAADSPKKDVGNNLFREWTDADRASISRMLDAAHVLFRDRVRAGRAQVLTDSNAVESVADGTVFTAEEAVANGLIDGIAYLDEAIAAAERRAGLTPGRATVVRLGAPPTIFDLLMSGPSTPLGSGIGSGLGVREVRTLIEELSVPRAMYLMR